MFLLVHGNQGRSRSAPWRSPSVGEAQQGILGGGFVDTASDHSADIVLPGIRSRSNCLWRYGDGPYVGLVDGLLPAFLSGPFAAAIAAASA